MGTAVFQDGYLILYKLDKEKDIFYDPLDQKNGQTDINPGGMEVKKRKLPAACFFVDYRTQTVPDNKNKK